MARLRRYRGGTLLTVAIALVATAAIVNGVTAVHDSSRVKLDRHVLRAYLGHHGYTSHITIPVLKVGRRADLACGRERGARHEFCLAIGDTGDRSANIERAWQCEPGDRSARCPTAHGNSVSG